MKYLILNSDTPCVKDTVFFTTDRSVGREPELLCPIVGVGENRFARPHQTHDDRILNITADFFSLPVAERERLMEGIDAVISDVRDCCLGISTADCIPVLVYDKAHNAAAAIHAGWRGTQKRIVKKAVEAMSSAFGTRAEDCEAVIGPGISLDSFEVGDEVYDAFTGAGFDMQAVAVRLPSRLPGDKQPERWHIDLKAVNRDVLVSSGIPYDNISISPIDTFTDQRFYSARREQKGSEKCGRILTGFVLR